MARILGGRSPSRSLMPHKSMIIATTRLPYLYAGGCADRWAEARWTELGQMIDLIPDLCTANWCGMMSWRLATSTTRTPGWKLSETILAFTSSGQRRLPRRGSTISSRPTSPLPSAIASFNKNNGECISPIKTSRKASNQWDGTAHMTESPGPLSAIAQQWRC